MKSITESLAKFITNTSSKTIPLNVINYTKTLTFDAIGTLVAATHPKVTSGKLITEFETQIILFILLMIEEDIYESFILQTKKNKIAKK